MQITKYAHACLVIEEQGQKLVIDPGSFTDSFGDLTGITAVVVTHSHMDHYNPAHLAGIAQANPGVPIFSVSEVSQQLTAPTVTVVEPGQTITAGAFTLQFFGGKHARIHETIPEINNVGVLVNNSLYYPGDSFAVPEKHPVAVLALPVSAPWMKIGEAFDFLTAVKPRLCFPTHNAILSDVGMAIVDNQIGNVCAQNQTIYHSLKPGQTITV